MQRVRGLTASVFASVAALLAGCATDAPVALAPTPVAAAPALPPPAPAPSPDPLERIPPLPSAQLLDVTRLPPFEGERRDLRGPQRVAKLDRTSRTDDLWVRLRRGFAMPDLSSPRVAERTAWYVANQDYLQRVFERSSEWWIMCQLAPASCET